MDLFVCVLLFCMVSISISDESNRKTYLVRYSNGQQTIPVTVVLDYKKQVEYVINMNSRTPTKSVTFYDFKERTIAYKDMTNKECFLGRLTHETLQEENELLQHLQNPVHTNPIVLNLASSRSSLTPTEVKNIAGDKIAMFCGKMSTWLLQESNSRSKREVESNRRHIDLNPAYQSVPLYRTDTAGIRNANNRHRNPIQVPDENKNELPSSLFSDDDINNLFHHYLRSHDARNDTLSHSSQYSHPISSSIPLYKSQLNNDVITFHSRDPKHQNNIHPGISIHRFDSLPSHRSHVDQFENSSRNSWPVQYHPRLPPGTGIHDVITNSIPQYPPQVGANNLFPSNFEYTHQLRRNSQGNHNDLNPPEKTNLYKDASVYNPGIQTIHIRPSEVTGTLRNTLQTGALRPGNKQIESRRFTIPPNKPPSVLLPIESPQETHNENVNSETAPINDFVERSNDHLSSVFRNTSEKEKTITDEISLVKINIDINDTHFRDDTLTQYRPYINAREATTTSNPFAGINELFGSENTLKDRSDIPHDPYDGVKIETQENYNASDSFDYSATNAVVVEGLPSHERAQKPIKLFTPDEIVINIENNRDHEKPQSTSNFNENSPDALLTKTTKNRLITVNSNRRRVNSSRNSSRHHQRIERPTRRPFPTTTVLPPGVAMYPRHPKAPYAQLSTQLSSKRPQIRGQEINRHHQRHRRKKNRRNQRCCSPGRKSCCENGQCCTSRKIPSRTSCCQGRKPTVRQIPPEIPSDIQNDIGTTKDELCDIKKMCRTLYQSTKAVKVCKINDVPDC